MLLQIQFLHPEFLYGLTLLTVPIVLHLFSLRRYKKVYFSNFNFLEALQQQFPVKKLTVTAPAPGNYQLYCFSLCNTLH